MKTMKFEELYWVQRCIQGFETLATNEVTDRIILMERNQIPDFEGPIWRYWD